MRFDLDYDRAKMRVAHVNYLKGKSIVLDEQKSARIRENFIEVFINKTRGYDRKDLLENAKPEEGIYYQGYLWDSLKNYNRVRNHNDLIFLDRFKNKEIYAMTDLHSERRFKNKLLYAFFPARNVILAKLNDIRNSLAALPQDLYIFDDTFSWYLILTHEHDELGAELYFQKPKKKKRQGSKRQGSALETRN